MLPLPALLAAFSPLFYALCILTLTIALLIVMRPRRFYFVRHGETLLNAAHVKQGAEGGLSERGRAQAAEVAERFAGLDIAIVLSSPYERAKETSEIIAARLKVAIVYSRLLEERRNPSEVIGKNRDAPEVVRIIDQMDLAYHEDGYRFSDEENFDDLKRRARRCLSWLIWRSSVHNCVVTHHAFLKMLLSYMLYRDGLHAKDYVKLSFFNTSDNAGVSVCEYHPWKMFSPTRGWEVVSYNEQAG